MIIVSRECPYCGGWVDIYRNFPYNRNIDGWAESKSLKGIKHRTLFHKKCAYKRRPNELTNI